MPQQEAGTDSMLMAFVFSLKESETFPQNEGSQGENLSK